MNVLVGILNGLAVAVCMLLYCGSFLIQPGDGGQPATAGVTNMFRAWAASVFAYCMVCLATAFAKRKGSGVLVTGIVAHVFLAAFVVLPFTDKHNGFGIFLFCCVFAAIYATLWFRMYSRLRPAAA
jgi:uncharacterized membrane protein